MAEKEKVCFVVMGFGKKTDFESGRLLDLDATYEAIIQPAVTENKFRCIRANEILHSGIIDTKMYEMLLRADLVIADISTGNVNAVYELGVRHALRPFSTIVMKESKGKMHFDLDHTSTFIYEHLGEDIGSREAKRAKSELSDLIQKVVTDPSPDSPVYTYIPTLRQPQISDEQFKSLLAEAEEVQEKFSVLLADAENASQKSDHRSAATKFSSALIMSPTNSYLRQQTALHTYKSKHPSEALALMKANSILEQLEPENSNDPETLGLSGAIYKRLWAINNDPATLDNAIKFYERGFELRGDYYTGENAATCLELRSTIQENEDEKKYDQMTAMKIRMAIIEQLSTLVDSDEFVDRSDRLWVFATLANCSIAIGEKKKSGEFEEMFMKGSPVDWQIETFRNGMATVSDFYSRN